MNPPTDEYRQLANEVVEDLKGAAYYRDPQVLGDFLRNRLGFGPDDDAPERVAEAIAQDLRGAGYYKDPEILADFLKGRLAGRLP